MAAVGEELSAFGPFFVFDRHEPGTPPPAPWRPMRELIDDSEVLAQRIAAVRSSLAVAGGQSTQRVPRRVAASVTHLGLVARLISPVMAVAVTRALVIHTAWQDLWWQPTLGSTFPLSLPSDADEETTTTNDDDLAEGIRRNIDGPIREITSAVETYSVSPQVLWGNVASAVNGATTMITTARPDLAEQSLAMASRLLDQPPLAGSSSTPPGPGFRRRSCCLIYRAAPDTAGPFCGDCILTN